MCVKKFVFIFVSLFSLAFSQTAQPDKKNILYFSASNSRIDNSQFFAISNALPNNFKLYHQSLDYNLYNSKSQGEQQEWPFEFLDFSKFDAIIIGDNSALEFSQKRRAGFLGKTPLVCIGTDNESFLDNAEKIPNVKIIKDEIFLEENIKLAMTLFPDRKKIAFIVCSDQQIEECESKMTKYEIDSESKNVAQMSQRQIEEYILQLEKCPIIFLPSPKELNENNLNSWRILDIILDSTENPIFVCHDIGMGEGVLGGYFISTEELGNSVARALGFFFESATQAKKENAPHLQQIQAQANYFFDFEQMKKFKIKTSLLNSKTIFINDNQVESAKQILLSLFFSLSLVLSAAIITLIFFAKKKINLQKAFLNEERIKLNMVLSQGDALFWECDLDPDKNDSVKFYKDEHKADQNAFPSENLIEGWIDQGKIPFEYIDHYNKMISDIKSGKETVSIDLPLQQEDAHTHLMNTVWKHIVYKNLNQSSGKSIRAIATAIDITNQKLAEEKYEGEMSYRAFVNKAYPAYTRLNLTNNIIMERMINIPEMKLAVKDSTADSELQLFSKITTIDGQNPALPEVLNRKELLTSFMNGTRSREWDFYYPFANGMIRWYLLHTEISLNPYTTCVEANLYLRDITEQKIMSISKDSVLDEEVEYILWLDLSNAKLHLIHKANNVNWISVENEVDYDALVQTILNDVVSAKDLNAAKEFFTLKNLILKLKDKFAVNCTFEIVSENLRVAIKQMRAYYLNNNQSIILFICRDITDITLFEKLQNEKLSNAIEQAKKANASKSDFLSRMSHDLRTPMNGIIGMAELVEDEVDKPQALREDIQKIKSSSKYMLGLLNDILDMAKIESGKMEIRKSRQSVGEIVEAITTMAVPMFETKNINFYCNVDTHKYKNFFVNIDRLHLQQIIMNLLSNASKFTPSEGRVELLLKILDRMEKTINVEIIVSDTGSGMSREFQQVMFDSFTQDVNSVNKVGTGLGLSIVHNLVNLMGGTIECDSAPGKGTTFKITLTMEFLEELAGSAQEKSNEKSKSKSEAELDGKKILLVEDNPLNQEISRRILQKKGMVVTIAENGKVALDTFSQSELNAFDLILMDVMMPVMGGIESATKIRALEREDAKNIPIIALTANAFMEDIQKCVDAGMNTHLSKPINPVLLINTIREYLA